MKIEVLTIESCPHAQPTLSLVQTIVAEERARAHVEHIVVNSEASARRLQFPGSPTVRVNGRDVEPGATEHGLACRVYNDGHRLCGVPPAELIRRAIAKTNA